MYGIIAAPAPDLEVPPLREVYLQRLQRLFRLRREQEEELNMQGTRLLDRSIFAVYCVCRDVGDEEAANKILRRARSDIPAEFAR